MLMILYLRNRDIFSSPGIRKIEDPETVMRWRKVHPSALTSEKRSRGQPFNPSFNRHIHRKSKEYEKALSVYHYPFSCRPHADSRLCGLYIVAQTRGTIRK